MFSENRQFRAKFEKKDERNWSSIFFRKTRQQFDRKQKNTAVFKQKSLSFINIARLSM